MFQDPAKNIFHGLSADEQRWFANIQDKYPGICFSDPPHQFYRTPPGGGAPILDGDMIYPSVAPEIAPLVFFVTASPRNYHGTRVETNTTRTQAPVTGTATDNSSGDTYHVEGTATITTTTTQDVPYSVDYDDLSLLVQQKQLNGTWKTLQGFERRTLCPALYGVCVGNRHPYEKLLEQGVKWIGHNDLPTIFDFQPESAPVTDAPAVSAVPATIRQQSTPIPTAGPERVSTPVSDALGIVSVTSSPDGAEIFIDSVGYGHAPAILKLSPGKHSIQMVRQGFQDWTSGLEVKENSIVNVTAKLVR